MEHTKEEIDSLKGKIVSSVISKDILLPIFNAYVPSQLSKQHQSTWEEKISVILSSYESYCRIVCGSYKKNGHEKKWNDFKAPQKRIYPITAFTHDEKK